MLHCAPDKGAVLRLDPLLVLIQASCWTVPSNHFSSGRSHEVLMYALNLTSFETFAIYGVLVIAVFSLIYAYSLFRNVMAEDKGTPAMIRIWTAIKDGADAYLGQPAKDDPAVHRHPGLRAVRQRLDRPADRGSREDVRRKRQHRHRIRSGRRVCPGRGLLADRRPVGHAHGRAGQHPRCGRFDAQLRRCAADRLPLRHRHRHVDRRPGAAGRHHDLHHLRRGRA